MSDYLVFLADIKGTKAALEQFDNGGCQVLERRIEHLQDTFGRCFIALQERSRNMNGVTFSDSVIAYWTDVVEGKRFGPELMNILWHSIDHKLVSIRGFLDSGKCVRETSILSHILTFTPSRFLKVLPTGLAVWSVAIAESSHFPDGMFVEQKLASGLISRSFECTVLKAGPFEYVQMNLD